MNLKVWIKSALYYAGYYRFRYAVKTSGNKRLLVLMYHDLVGDDEGLVPGERGYGHVSKGAFEAHLKAIRDCCRIISVEDAVAEIRNKGTLSENSVAITFDDGYASAYDIAFPLLKKYGCNATIYLLTDWIDGKISLWWEELGDMIRGFEVNAETLSELQRIGGELNIEISRYSPYNENMRSSMFQIISHEFMKLQDDRRKEFMVSLRSILSKGAGYKRTELRTLTWDQITEMADAGIMFGGHTSSHINLSHADMDSARDEISRSKKEIESHLGREVTGFAYPYGYDVKAYAKYNPVLEELGFAYACTSWWGNNTVDSNLFQLFRNILPPMKSHSLLRREIYLNFTEKAIDPDNPPSNYP